MPARVDAEHKFTSYEKPFSSEAEGFSRSILAFESFLVIQAKLDYENGLLENGIFPRRHLTRSQQEIREELLRIRDANIKKVEFLESIADIITITGRLAQNGHGERYRLVASVVISQDVETYITTSLCNVLGVSGVLPQTAPAYGYLGKDNKALLYSTSLTESIGLVFSGHASPDNDNVILPLKALIFPKEALGKE